MTTRQLFYGPLFGMSRFKLLGVVQCLERNSIASRQNLVLNVLWVNF